MDFSEIININPRVQYYPGYDMKPDTSWYGIKALCYDGADYKGQKTKIFAHIGYPEMKDGEKVPAIVLVHGGGGHAFPEWIKIWNRRGFAAIAMDTTGFVPREDRKGVIGTEACNMAANMKKSCTAIFMRMGIFQDHITAECATVIYRWGNNGCSMRFRIRS